MRAISLAASRGSLVLNCCSAAPRCDWLRQCLSRWWVRCAGSIESHDCCGTGPAACCATGTATGNTSSVLQLSRLPSQLAEASAVAGRRRAGGGAAAAAASAAQAGAEGGAAQAARLLHCRPARAAMGAGRVRASIWVAVGGWAAAGRRCRRAGVGGMGWWEAPCGRATTAGGQGSGRSGQQGPNKGCLTNWREEGRGGAAGGFEPARGSQILSQTAHRSARGPMGRRGARRGQRGGGCRLTNACSAAEEGWGASRPLRMSQAASGRRRSGTGPGVNERQGGRGCEQCLGGPARCWRAASDLDGGLVSGPGPLAHLQRSGAGWAPRARAGCCWSGLVLRLPRGARTGSAGRGG